LSGRTDSWIVAEDSARTRLDQFLVRCIPGESRSRVQAWIRAGHVEVNGQRVKSGYRMRPHDRVVLAAPAPAPPLPPCPEDIPLDILYEDADLAVVNKPAGLVCHSGAGVRSHTLVNALLYRMGPLDTGDPVRPGIVHRLDKFTSGVLVVAKNLQAHRALSQQFKARKVRKQYLALVHGTPAPVSGTIDRPIGRDPKDRKRMSVLARRSRAAITHYSVLETRGPLSLLEVRIETGRTHQIRVHLASQGHPVVGDSVYRRASGGQAAGLGRPFLHAYRLEFRHPRSGEPMSFAAPLPAELLSFLSRVGLCRCTPAK